jgi:MFS family permease
MGNEPRARSGRDARIIFAAQAVRAFAYGFGAVLLGAALSARGFSSARVGLVLTCVLAGMAIMSALVGAFGDRVGRRRFYVLLFCGLAITGVVVALTDSLWALIPIALTGTLSTDVIESGPFTSLEQAMLPAAVPAERRARVFGTYNAVAALSGSVGALAAGGPELLRRALHTHAPAQRYFLVFVPVGVAGALLARALSADVESERFRPGGAAVLGERTPPLHRSRATVLKLAALFATDSFAGGFVVQSFVAYWFFTRLHASLGLLGIVFFAAGLMQTASFLVATRIAERFGLLNTMVFTHLPSNVLLAVIPLVHSLPFAIALLLARQLLSQMDVPTRQAYVVALVDPDERTAAAAWTNTARYVTRPFGPALAGATQRFAAGMPFFIGGGLKALYDLTLYAWFRRVPLAERDG